SVWEGLRHQVFLGSEAFVERHCATSRSPERLREVPRAQRRPLAKPLADFARRYPDRREAMAWAFQTGVYTLQEIADYFGVHYSTVSRAVRRLEAGRGSEADWITKQQTA
ncbi:MAG: helix-turn-helix domain-containing protein, partial [Caldilineaceae bacterium]